MTLIGIDLLFLKQFHYKIYALTKISQNNICNFHPLTLYTGSGVYSLICNVFYMVRKVFLCVNGHMPQLEGLLYFIVYS